MVLMTVKTFQKKIREWHQTNRRDLPFRRTKNPYRILVSEIMLQQTQIARVLPKYKEFLKAFPVLKTLAKAPRAELLKVWQGLGYWRRAAFLQECAGRIMKDFHGKFPKDPNILETLPGIGHYTARAVACFAFQNPEAFLDTNIRRVYLHFFFPDRKKVSDKEILPVAQKAVWKENPREWHYALFDYGALVLKNKTINKKSLHYHRQSKFKESFRFYRTQAMKFLLIQPERKTSKKNLTAFLKNEIEKGKKTYTPLQIISALEKDGLIKTKGTHITL